MHLELTPEALQADPSRQEGFLPEAFHALHLMATSGTLAIPTLQDLSRNAHPACPQPFLGVYAASLCIQQAYI